MLRPKMEAEADLPRLTYPCVSHFVEEEQGYCLASRLWAFLYSCERYRSFSQWERSSCRQQTLAELSRGPQLHIYLSLFYCFMFIYNLTVSRTTEYSQHQLNSVLYVKSV